MSNQIDVNIMEEDLPLPDDAVGAADAATANDTSATLPMQEAGEEEADTMPTIEDVDVDALTSADISITLPTSTTDPQGQAPAPEDAATEDAPQPNTATAQPQEPAQKETVKDDPSFFDYLLDISKGIANAPVNALNETIDLAGTLAQGGKEFNIVETGKKYNVDFSNFGETTTGIGKFAEDISTFLAGFVTGGKLLKSMSLLQGAGKATSIGRGMAQSFYSTVTGYDGHEKMLSNLVQEYPEMQNIITESLAVSKDDSELLGRLKHGFEGLALDSATELAIATVGLFKASKVSAGTLRDAELIKAMESLEGIRAAAEKEGLDPAAVLNAGEGKGKGFVLIPTGQKGRPRKDGLPTGSTPLPPPASEALTETIRQAPADARPLDIVHELNYRNGFTASEAVLKATTPEEGYSVLSGIAEAMRNKQGIEETVEVTLQRTFETAQRLAEDFDMPRVKNYMQDVLSDVPADGLRGTDKPLAMLETSLTVFTEDALRLARKMDINPAAVSPQDRLDFITLKKNIDSVYRGIALTKDMPQDIALFKVHETPKGLSVEQSNAILTGEGWTPDILKKLSKDIVLNADNPAAIAKAINNTTTASKLGMLQEFRINNMLSSPVTQSMNAVSNVLKAALMPAERYLAGAITGNPAMRQEALDTVTGLFTYFSDATRLAKRAFKVTGEDARVMQEMAAGVMESNSTARITYENIRDIMLKDQPRGTELSPIQELLARQAGGMAHHLRLPSRILMSTDTFFRQLNFRASLSAGLRREAVEQAGLKSAADIERYVNEGMRETLAAQSGNGMEGITSSQSTHIAARLQTAQQYAKKATWTQELGADTWAGGFQQYANEHPMLRLVVPFIRTPANLMRDFVAHTPLIGNLSKQYRQAIAKGGDDAAIAKAQLASGSLMWAGVISLAASGSITGSAPKDPKLRAAMEATGWQPYSVKIGDRYYSYRRLDPAATMLGIAADMAQAGMSESLTEQQYADLAQSAILALSQNVLSKTYMQSVSEVLGHILDGDQRNATAFFGNQATSLIPFSSALRYTRQTVDENMREVRDFTDYLLNTVAGFSDTLPAKRHWVTGEVKTYAMAPKDKHDIVLDELNLLAHTHTGMRAAPARTLHGVELTAEQYSRLNELHGTLTLNGKTLHKALEELFKSEGYDLHRQTTGNPVDGETSPRGIKVNRIIDRYRNAAKDRLVDEDPTLAQSVRQSDYQRQLSRRGKMTSGNQKELLEALIDAY